MLYVSTVDSGNLAGHLLTLRGGLLGLADEPILTTRLFGGLGDTLGLLADSVDEADAVSYTHLRAHETVLDLVCRLLLAKKKIPHHA